MENNQFIYKQEYEGMEGIVLESRGGAKDSNNFRNPDYKFLRRFILELLKQAGETDVQIYIAARNSVYKNLEDRLISIDGVTEFDFNSIGIDDFETKLNEAVRTKGQVPNAKGGNDTKKLFFRTKCNLNMLNDNPVEVKDGFDLEAVLKEFSFDFNRPLDDRNLLKTLVNELQDALYQFLKINLPSYNWQKEYTPSTTRKDSFDIYGYNATENRTIVVELDPHRADSIAKKFVSRIVLLKNENLYYVAFLYPGTDKMPKNEAIKYCDDCAIIAEAMNTENATKKFLSHFL
ncbi:hypothetical protein BPO_0864 [Bergeyella porcorum]|uniref:Uncharacterized protein n=1 Tax=Bergeyella porcorum TaxID=1735111 RepID=A0AAU0F0E7_9FLAO